MREWSLTSESRPQKKFSAEVRERAVRMVFEHSGATFETIRRVFVKVAVRVEELKGRIKLAFPATYPEATMLATMTGAFTTRGP